jgi:hypothetical protein
MHLMHTSMSSSSGDSYPHESPFFYVFDAISDAACINDNRSFYGENIIILIVYVIPTDTRLFWQSVNFKICK